MLERLRSIGVVVRLAGLFALLVFATSAHGQVPVEGDVQIGPYRLGMTAEEVQVAGSGLTWEVERIEHVECIECPGGDGGGALTVSAEGGLSLAWQVFDVHFVYSSPPDPIASLTFLMGFSSRTAVDVDACEADILNLVGVLEEQLGALAPPFYGNADVVAAGKMSTVAVERSSFGGIEWETSLVGADPPNRHEPLVHFEASYYSDTRCSIDVTVAR